MMPDDERKRMKDAGYCEHGNRPPCLFCAEKNKGESGGVETEPVVSEQEKNMRRSQDLIMSIGGEIDNETNPYKHFDATKHERFYIQKGRFNERDVVFKVGEQRNSERLADESRNLKVLEQAEGELASPLDVHIVKQVGDLYQGEGMMGLATEFLEDDKDVKKELDGQKKVQIISRVIENLQRLSVPSEVIESSGLTVHNAEKIERDGKYFVQTLEEDGFFDAQTAERLRSLFQSASTDLAREQLVFVHGDAHGDNIFVQRAEDGELDLSLIDIEGLRISNRYHDWSEILNKATFLQHLERERSDLFSSIADNVKNMWLDGSVEFDEDVIIQQVCGDDEQKRQNFRITRIYDLLSRAMSARGNEHPFEQEARKVRKQIIEEELAKLTS
jgi:thiamine kinase-like enzyme